MVMNKRTFQTTAIMNLLLIVGVGALHTAALATMLSPKSLAVQASVAGTVDLQMVTLGDHIESIAEVEEVIEETLQHPHDEEMVQMVAVNTAVQAADVVVPIEAPVVKAKPKPTPKPKAVERVVKAPSKPAKAQAARTQGGRPFVAASRIEFLKNPQPKRPRAAHRKGLRGNSVVIIELNAQGAPTKVVLERSSGHKMLDEAALNAANGVKIRPYRENGQAIAIRHRIDYAF